MSRQELDRIRWLYDYGPKLKANKHNNSSDLEHYDAQVCLKSWIRTLSSSTAFRTRRQGSLRSVRCAPLGGPNYDMGIALNALGRGQNFQRR